MSLSVEPINLPVVIEQISDLEQAFAGMLIDLPTLGKGEGKGEQGAGAASESGDDFDDIENIFSDF